MYFSVFQWKKQLSPSRWNQLMPINSVPHFVEFHVLEHQKLHPDPSQPGIARYTCTWTLIDNFGNDQLARPCIFSESGNYFFVQRNRDFFCQLACRNNIAEELVRITRPFRRPNERDELSILFFDWVSLSWMQPLAASQNSSLRVTLGSRQRSDVMYENRAFPNCFTCRLDSIWVEIILTLFL